MFRDAWFEQEIEQETEFFSASEDYFDSSARLLNQTQVSKPPVDRPQIPKALWDQLPQDAKLWYIHKDLRDNPKKHS